MKARQQVASRYGVALAGHGSSKTALVARDHGFRKRPPHVSDTPVALSRDPTHVHVSVAGRANNTTAVTSTRRTRMS